MRPMAYRAIRLTFLGDTKNVDTITTTNTTIRLLHAMKMIMPGNFYWYPTSHGDYKTITSLVNRLNKESEVENQRN
jgi:hypothetical protein